MFQIAKSQTMLDNCFEIRKCVFAEEQDVPLENEFDQYEDYSSHIVEYINGVPMATTRIGSLNTHICKTERVAIIKWYRGPGYGKNLIHTIETIAKKHQYNELIVNVQLQARDFYLKLGYSPFGKIFLEENINHISMNKLLQIDLHPIYKFSNSKNCNNLYTAYKLVINVNGDLTMFPI